MNCTNRCIKGEIGLAGLPIKEIRNLLRLGGFPTQGNRLELCNRLVESGSYYFDGNGVILISNKGSSSSSSSSRGKIVTRYNPTQYIPEEGKRSIIESFPLHNYFYPFYNPIYAFEQRSITLQREGEIGIMEGIRHPFPVGIGLTEDGQPTPALSEFTKSKDYPLTLLRAMKILGDVSNSMDLLRVMEVQLEGELLCCVYFDLLTTSQAHTISSIYKSEVISLCSLLEAQRFGGVGVSLLISTKDDGTVRMLRDTIRHYKNVRIVVNMHAPGSRTGHVSQLHIDTDSRIAYYIDSSSLDMCTYIELTKSLELFLRVWIGFECTIPIPSFCYDLQIQEQSPTCAGWTLYILLLSILNKELHGDDLVHILGEYDLYSRDLLISTFYFYLFQVTDYIRVSPNHVDSFSKICQELPSF